MREGEPVEDERDLENDEWFRQHYVELTNYYPRQWIAVIGQKVVAHGSTKAGVESDVERMADGKPYSLYFVETSAIMP